MLTRLSILVRALADDQKSADARLRRVSTRSKAYEVGQPFTIVRVPQPLMLGMCDVGHVSVLVQNHDGTLASMGFYSRSYRRGLSGSLITRDDGILVSPDPLYARASRDPALRPLVVPIYRGALTEEQADRLNAWTDDAAEQQQLEYMRFTTRAGEVRETLQARLDERYMAAAMLLPAGADNCVTWVQKQFPGCIECTLGMPRFCRAAASDAGAAPAPAS